MKELEMLHTCKPVLSTNGGGYFLKVQLYRSSTSETIEVKKYISSNDIFKIDLYRQDLQKTEP